MTNPHRGGEDNEVDYAHNHECAYRRLVTIALERRDAVVEDQSPQFVHGMRICQYENHKQHR